MTLLDAGFAPIPAARDHHPARYHLSMPMRILAHAIAALITLFSLDAAAQSHPGYFDIPSTTRVIGTPPPGARLPLVIVLPPTGSSASDVYALLAPQIAPRSYVVMLPAGAPTRADYTPFDAFFRAFENRITTDIAAATTQYPIDPSRIYLVGFSLGGDLSWALIAHHADRYAGAFVMSSRCSAGISGASLTSLRNRHAHVVFAIGDADDASRVSGLTHAHDLVSRAGVTTQLFRFAGGHELPTDPAAISDAFRELLDGVSPP